MSVVQVKVWSSALQRKFLDDMGELAQEGAVIFLCLCASSFCVCVGGGSKIEHRCFSKEGDTYLIVTRLLFLLSRERRAYGMVRTYVTGSTKTLKI